MAGAWPSSPSRWVLCTHWMCPCCAQVICSSCMATSLGGIWSRLPWNEGRTDKLKLNVNWTIEKHSWVVHLLFHYWTQWIKGSLKVLSTTPRFNSLFCTCLWLKDELCAKWLGPKDQRESREGWQPAPQMLVHCQPPWAKKDDLDGLLWQL